MKFKNTLLKLCHYSWATAFVANIMTVVILAFHHTTQLDLESASLDVLGLIVCWIFLRRGKRAQAKNQIVDQLWRAPRIDVRRHSPGLAVLMSFGLFIQTISLCVIIALALKASLFFGGTVLSYGTYSAGQYELGETIFKLTRTNRHDLRNVSLAGLWNHQSGSSRAFGADDNRLTEVITQVYGAESREAAYRQEGLGTHAYWHGYDLRSRGADNPEILQGTLSAERYFQKALSIYQRNDALVEQVRVLQMIVMTQRRLESYDEASANLTESRRTLDKAIKMSADCRNEEDLADTLNDLARNLDYETENSRGAKAEASSLRQRAKVIMLGVRDDNIRAGLKLMCLLLVVLGAASGAAVSRKAITNRIRLHSLLALSLTPHSTELLRLLNNLVLIELSDRNMVKADLYSKRLLATAEGL
jgi:hypothetical protein